MERLRTEPYVTIDTEFVRERTYYPELCLVQLAGEQDVALIDTLAPGLDLAPLGALLADKAVLKVFHAARQDLEIFLHQFGALPTPLFDTQVAAMVAGHGDQVGYDTLVGALTGAAIDKAHRFSDWSARPLTDAQRTYAAADVTHLRVVYQKLAARLDEEGRSGWMESELAVLNDPETFRPNPETLWEKLRPRTGNRRMLGVLRATVAWREREAQRVDVPRQRIIRDESLLEVAATTPTDAVALARVRGVTRGFAEGKSGLALLAVISEALALPESDLPRPAKGGKEGARPSPALVSLLKVLLTAKCEAHQVAPKLVASAEDIDALALGSGGALSVLHGWRGEVFGADAVALREGRLSLGVEGNKVRLIRS
ncbi:ribonuclease D [Ameyamaea chiangmaiensis NBRC 103196]|nr:ribonuclease D [Ameyamaea chiangmaiensis NBRC 103196]